jgi:hypothetical protein
MKTLNEVYSRLSTRRRYEVWFVRLGLADGNGAWWFRYLLTNPGREGCGSDLRQMPVQVWASYFPPGCRPQTFIQGFPLSSLGISAKGQSPFQFRVGANAINEDSCRGHLQLEGHEISWDLRYQSGFRATLSDKGWIGFSRTPHSGATFAGEIAFDDLKFRGEPIGFGVQGHNCGYRHRSFWTWAHACFPGPTTFEALVYDMPLGLFFRKAVLWHGGRQYFFRDFSEITRNRHDFRWEFRCSGSGGTRLQVIIDGSGPGVHCLPYVKTDCSGSFEVRNNSLAKAEIQLQHPAGQTEVLDTAQGAVLEMVGE